MSRAGRARRGLLVLLALPGLALCVRDLFDLGPAAAARGAADHRTIAGRAAEEFGVPVDLVLAVIAVESGGDPRARSAKGALGLMQLMPATAAEQAVLLGEPPPDEGDLFDPRRNVRLGTRYLAELLRRFHGDERLAVAAYHAGPTRVSDWRRSRPGATTDEILSEVAYSGTRSYVSSVWEMRGRWAAAPSER